MSVSATSDRPGVPKRGVPWDSRVPGKARKPVSRVPREPGRTRPPKGTVNGTPLTRDGAGGNSLHRSEPDEPLLISKITVPALPSWAVRRGRIDRMIEEGADGPLTVVTGPPGAGKTMALAWWAAAERHAGPVAWVTLDSFDDQPGVLWPYVMESLRRSGVAMPEDLDLPVAGRSGHDFLRQIASVLAAQDPPVALVLDDIHLLTGPDSLDGLAYVLRNASAGLHVLVASRFDPLLPLHRYRLHGELTEVRAADLAFSLPEARALFAQHGVSLSAQPLEALTRKTEGWAAGLRLAAMSLENHPDPDRFVAAFGARQSAVTGYFVEEVLSAQPAEIRDVLLRTSILDQVSPALAGELAGGAKAAAVIPRLAGQNAFVQPIGGDWYRYHPLFAEVLRLKLRHEHEHDVARLHRQAASWLRRNGMLADAVRQLGSAGEWRLAARITVEDLPVGQLADSRAGTAVAETFRRQPATAGGSDPPALIVAAAMRLRDLDDQAGAAWLRRADHALAALPAGDEIPSRLAAQLLHADIARRSGDLSAAKAAVAGTGELLAGLRNPAAGRPPTAGGELLFLHGAVAMWSGHLQDAAAILEEAAGALDGASEWADCAGYWGLLEAIRGRLGLAAGLAAPATVPAPADRGTGHPGPASRASAAAETALAWVHLEHLQLDEAGQRLSRAEAALRARPDKLISAVTCLVMARLSLARGRAAAAALLSQRARQQWTPPPWLESRLMDTESHAHAMAGDGCEPDPVIVEDLSGREREVLGYVSGMLSTAEIADEMYISVNTVKSHLKSIFRKLGASRRGEAVRRARDLQLI